MKSKKYFSLSSALILVAFVAAGGVFLQARGSAQAAQVSVLTYELKFTNTTDKPAYNVDLKNPIPTGTAYFPGTLVVDGVAQTDAQDSDHAYFLASPAEIHFAWSEVAPGASHSMELGIYLLPGVTYEDILNQAYLPPPENADAQTLSIILHETSVCGNSKIEIVRDADGKIVTSQGKIVREICDDGTHNGTGYGWCKADCSGISLPTGKLCGNGKVDKWTNLKTGTVYAEKCDVGEENGEPGKCNATCSGFLAAVPVPKPPKTPTPPPVTPPGESPPTTAIGGMGGVATPATAEPPTTTPTISELPAGGATSAEVPSGEEGRTVLETLRELPGRVLGTLSSAVQAASRILSEPAVENTAAPALGAIAVVSAVSVAGYLSFFNYLFYIFTQPISLFWRRKKEKYGVVYDSLTKLPLDLAAVRLKDGAGRIMQTKVTDRQGRYNFLIAKGQYVLDIAKQGYLFPSSFLAGWTQDVDYIDLLTTDKIALKTDGAITSNVPVDPSAQEKTPRQIKRKAFFRKLQGATSILTTLLALGALALAPSYKYLALAIFQVLVYLLFRRLSYRFKPSSFGAIKDAASGQPIKNAVVRIMDAQFNRVLETQVTDVRGRYAFLVGKGKFFITANANGYEMFKGGILDYTGGKGTAVIDQAVRLKKAAQAIKSS